MIYGSLPGSVPLGGFLSQIKLTAQSMILTPVASPCYGPCTMIINVTWINNTAGTLQAGQVIGIMVDGTTPMDGSTTTTSPINMGETVSHTFTVRELFHINPNLICPVPN